MASSIPPSAGPSMARAMHGVRVLGYASASKVAELYGHPAADVHERLLDAQAHGYLTKSEYGGQVGWSMTDRGREAGERMLADELGAAGVRDDVVAAHRDFLPLNVRLGELMTRWQVRPTPDNPLALNDHDDLRYDDRVLRALDSLITDLRPVTARLAAAAHRLGVHQPRLEHALNQALAGRTDWVDSPLVPSVNLVWIQLHEDLVATLGLQRGQEGEGPPAP